MKFYNNKYPISDNIEYVIDYVYNNIGKNYYFQLVRLCDETILYASLDQTDVFMYCWNIGIAKNVIGLI